MSTRSITGIWNTEVDPVGVGVYCHSDGYPEGRLPDLKRMIVRDGPEKVVETILSAKWGGWSYLFTDYTENRLGDRARLVPGYGLMFLDGKEDKPIKDADLAEDGWWCEYRYYIDVETGDIHWYEGDSTHEHVERFAEYSVEKVDV